MEVSLTCQVCANNPHKYTCPRCQTQTCSLACCREHKEKMSCSGVREPVVYYRRNEYGAFAFQQDYHLLEEIDRRNAFRERQLFSLTQRNRAKMRGRAEIIRIAKSSGIDLRLSSTIFKRAANNRTRVVNGPDGQKSIVWSVEFNLLPATKTYESGTNLGRLNPLRLVLHDCTDQARIGSLWYDRLLKMDPEQQDSLVTHTPQGSPPFGLVTSWMFAKVKVNSAPTPDTHYFYVQVEQIKSQVDNTSSDYNITSRQYIPVEIFSTNRLSHILATPHLIVHEMPTIWVSRIPLV
ncbi:Box C/D snoRNA protein 1 [Fasciola hepatica]|uniref:Box C/D snoRNA protein 1 n=1 Tax=Fasciola hepatica TaxID=6192 RepID=A0A4E0RWX4_FASHE|nr:Box C/D snoRNA protein 1 [Fasciola hepatica]